MARIRVKRNKMNRPKIFKDDEVSLFAKGLFACALAIKKQSFDIKHLLVLVPEDTDDVYKGIMELRNKGYCKRVKVDGKIEFQFLMTQRLPRDTRNVQRIKKEPLLYSKEVAQGPGASKQSREPDPPREDPEFAGWDEIPVTPTTEVTQPSFLKERVKKNPSPQDEVIPVSYHKLLYRICFLIETETEALTLTSRDRGRVSSVLGRLKEAKADLTQMHKFEDWWNSQWRSRDSLGAYQPPSPEQVIQFWVQAMKHKIYKLTPLIPDQGPNGNINLAELMRNKRNES